MEVFVPLSHPPGEAQFDFGHATVEIAGVRPPDDWGPVRRATHEYFGLAVVTDQGDVLMAVAKYGKGTVFAVVDPWVYNEYVDRQNRLPVEYDGFAAPIDLAGWAVRQAK